MKKLSALIILSALVTSMQSVAGSFLLNEHNLVTVGDVNASSLHVHGSTLIGGDLNSAGLMFGERLTDTDTSLTVAGRFVETQNGSVSTKGHVVVDDQNNVFAVNASQTKVNGTYVNNSKSVTTQDLDGVSTQIASELQAMSDDFKAMGVGVNANSTVVVTENKKHTFDTSGVASNEYAVFSLDQSSAIFNNTPNQEIEILANSVAGIVVNVAGANIDFSANFIGGSNNNLGNIIWNFYEAVSINLSRAFYGSILAPLATLTSSNDIDGSVGVYEIASSHSGQIHNQINTLVPPVKVPEPPVWALFIVLLLAMSRRVIKSKNA